MERSAPLKATGRDAASRKYDLLTALGLYALGADRRVQRLVLRLITLVTARYDWRAGEASIGRRDLARLWAVDERTVKRELAGLRALGLISVKRPAARGRVAAYALEIGAVWEASRPDWGRAGADFAARAALLAGDRPRINSLESESRPAPGAAAPDGLWPDGAGPVGAGPDEENAARGGVVLSFAEERARMDRALCATGGGAFAEDPGGPGEERGRPARSGGASPDGGAADPASGAAALWKAARARVAREAPGAARVWLAPLRLAPGSSGEMGSGEGGALRLVAPSPCHAAYAERMCLGAIERALSVEAGRPMRARILADPL